MKKTMKKILSLVMVLAMCVSVAMPIFAAETTTTCPGEGELHTVKIVGAENCTEVEVVKVCGEVSYVLYRCNGCQHLFVDNLSYDLVDVDHSYEAVATNPEDCTTATQKVCTKCGQEAANTATHDFTFKVKVGDVEVEREWVLEEGAKCGDKDALATRSCQNEGCKVTETKTLGEIVASGDVAAIHQLSLIEIITEADCKNGGEAKFKCDICAAEVVLDTPAVAHDFSIDVPAKAETCDEVGNYATKACSYCGEYQNGDADIIDDYDGHIAAVEDLNEGKAPTCTNWGYKVIVCSTCGENEAVTLRPLGHCWERTGHTSTCTNCVVDPATCDKDEYTYCGYCSTNIKTGDMIAHASKTTIPVAANCQRPGYTYDVCADCDTFGDCDHATKEECIAANCTKRTYSGEKAENVHIYKDVIIREATCIAPGEKNQTPICGCSNAAPIIGTQIPATSHNYTPVDANGDEVDWNSADAVNVTIVLPNCIDGNGYYTIECINCWRVNVGTTLEDTVCCDSESIKYYPDELAYDVDVKDYHNGALTKLDTLSFAGSCVSPAYDVYFCDACGHNLKDYYNGTEAAHDWNATPVVAPSANGCENDGSKGVVKCNVCNLYAVADKLTVTYENLDDAKAAAKLDKKNHAFSVVQEAVEPDCVDNGWKVIEKCANCGLYKVGDTKNLNELEARALAYIAHYGHARIQTSYTNIKPDSTYTKCNGEYAFTYVWCLDCETEYLGIFVKVDCKTTATFHEATCTDDAYITVTCAYHCDNCTYDPANKIAATAENLALYNLTAEAEGKNLVATGHEKFVDADNDGIVDSGEIKPILCEDADTLCYNCGQIIKKWDTHADYVQVVKPVTCVDYGYVINECLVCKDREVLNLPEKPEDIDHTWSVWVVEDEPTFTTPGKKVRTCLIDGCDAEEEEEIPALVGVEFVYTVDNAIVSGAEIVNSGYVGVVISANALNQTVSTMNLKFTYDNRYLSFYDYEVLNDAFANSTFVGGNDATGVAGVVMATQKTPDGKLQNYTLNGETDLVMVIFSVNTVIYGESGIPLAPLDYVTVEFTSVLAEAVNMDNDSISTAVAGEVIEIEGVEVGDTAGAGVNGPIITLGATSTSTGDNETKIIVGEATIYELGDINGDGNRVNGQVATTVDANALLLLWNQAEPEYDAKADIDKDGAITAADYELLMNYIVGNYTYEEICSVGAAIEDVEEDVDLDAILGEILGGLLGA